MPQPFEGFLGGSVVKNLLTMEETQDTRFDPCVGKRKKWLQYSGLGKPMDRGAWQAIVYGVAKSWTRLSTYASLPLQETQ